MVSGNQREIALPPAVWGPIFWYTMHIVALGYPPNPPPEYKAAAKQFYESLQYLIPCPVCREHYAVHLKELPLEPALNSRSDLIHWTWQIHNLVNESLGKRQITLDEFLDTVSNLQPPFQKQKQSGSSSTSWVTIVGTLAAGAALGFGAAWYLRKLK